MFEKVSLLVAAARRQSKGAETRFLVDDPTDTQQSVAVCWFGYAEDILSYLSRYAMAVGQLSSMAT